MDNIITGAFGVIVFLLFTGGLAESIGELPFVLIVIAVGIMLVVDFYESVRDERQKEKDRNSSAPE